MAAMTLRILTVLAGAKVGGAEAFFVSLTLALKAAGVTVRSAMKANGPRERALAAAGIAYDLVRFGVLFDVLSRRKLARIAEDFRPDIVLTFAGRASAAMPKGEYAFIGRLGGYYNLKNFRKCDYLVCNAPDLVRYAVAGGWPKERVFHIPNFPRLEKGAAVDRASLGTPQSAKLALALGRLHPNKAFDVLVKAAALVPGLFVWIAGEGPERGNLEKLARDLGVTERVKFLGWREDRAGLFKAADVCVYPSREEPFGNVVVEAWGYGVPLVTTASRGPAWLVRDGEDAILTPVDDEAALADGIRAVIASPELGERLARNGRNRIEKEFSERAIIRRYIDLFEAVRPKATQA
jgi:glycosyltransferase involved in cell wall biosynthesis